MNETNESPNQPSGEQGNQVDPSIFTPEFEQRTISGLVDKAITESEDETELTRMLKKEQFNEYDIYDVDEELNNSQNLHKKSSGGHGISWNFIFIVVLILLPIRLFVAEPFLVYGSSMEPNFDTGDYLVVDELTYRFEEPKRGDVVVLQPPTDKTKHFIKRIIGLPGETVDVKGSIVTIYNTENPEGFTLIEPYLQFFSDKESRVTLKNNEYYVMGDNRSVSYDSRSWGPLPRENITGRAFLRLYPLQSISILPGDSSKY